MSIKHNLFGRGSLCSNNRAIELIAAEIRRNNIEGAVAEAGVDYGDCSWVINEAFPDRTFYLYDTFSGFDQRDIAIERRLYDGSRL